MGRTARFYFAWILVVGLAPNLTAVSADTDGSEYFYALSFPQKNYSALGPVAQAAHIAFEPALQIFKAVGAYYAANHSIAALLSLLIPELIKTPMSITLQSYGHLQMRFYRDISRRARPIFSLHGDPVLKLVTASSIRTSFGFLVTEKESTGFLFLVTRQPISPEEWQTATAAKFGNLIPLAEAKSPTVDFELKNENETILDVWSVSVFDLLNGRPIPHAKRHQWINLFKTEKTNIRLTSQLKMLDGFSENLGTIAEGIRLKKLLRLDWVSQSHRWLEEKLGRRRPGTFPARIPVATIVEGGLFGIVKLKCFEIVHHLGQAVLKTGELAPFRGADRFTH